MPARLRRKIKTVSLTSMLIILAACTVNNYHSHYCCPDKYDTALNTTRHLHYPKTPGYEMAAEDAYERELRGE